MQQKPISGSHDQMIKGQPVGVALRSETRSFDSYGFREVARLIDIAAATHRDVVREKL